MLVAEYNPFGTLKQRYLHGAASGDDPIAWFEDGYVTAASLRHLLADERGSIVGISDAGGNLIAVNAYDEYGVPNGTTNPAAANIGRFQYTGQICLPELGMYHYKARIYSPTLGRFLQTDPIGYEDAPNLYAYVGNDPVNAVDPTGMYGRGEGFSNAEWQRFYRAQQRAANRIEGRANQLRSAMAAGGNQLQQARARFENTYGAGTGTTEGMNNVLSKMDSAVAALRDNGSGGHIAIGLSASQWAALPNSNAAAAGRYIGDNRIAINLGHATWQSGTLDQRAWVVGHEAGHNIGLSHGPSLIPGFPPYLLGAPPPSIAAYDALTPSQRMNNPDAMMRYSYGYVPD